ncbi:MAG: aminomethyl-transferring glycine dehydrogenase subunit GcvPB, partial [Candidatus Krumholzibacteria bacterium]|nr:aminomethyl-transferring glycine dehydrogenase subunit GcvPB [Candidatus Krumholzibacteria bacterium]
MGETIYSKSRRGRSGYRFSTVQPAQPAVPEEYLRQGPIGLPEVSEPQVVRHYIGLSAKNHHVDKDLFPLGSCTMKYNPKINETVARYTGFTGAHPYQPEELSQGNLEL